MHEFALIRELLAPLAHAPGAYGLEDDAAWVPPTMGQEWVLTQDAVVAGVHFFADDPPGCIARKALRVNLSDIAAKGAQPQGYLLTLALPASTTREWLEAFVEGLAQDQQAYAIGLLGGDTVVTPGPLMISVTMLGTVPHAQRLRRSGACVGDRVYVSGTLGDSALGLRLQQQNIAPHTAGCGHYETLIARYRLPQPRLALGQTLRNVASSAMDISDGVLQDLGHLCAASGVGAKLYIADMPLSNAAQHYLPTVAGDAALAMETLSLCGGDDYELLFTVPKHIQAGQLGDDPSVPVTCVGEIVAEAGVRVMDAAGRVLPITNLGYQHILRED